MKRGIMAIEAPNGKKERHKVVVLSAIVTCIVVEVLLTVFLITSLSGEVFAISNEDNTTSETLLSIGNPFPEILSIEINSGNAVSLTANATTTVSVLSIVRDYFNATDLGATSGIFFDSVNSSLTFPDDNNNHYTNSSCLVDTSYGDQFEANVSCSFALEYYSNNATWNFTLTINDSQPGSETSDSNTTTVNTLLAVALPNQLDYGQVNSTEVSSEQIVNVTNAGNVRLNLSLSGYGAVPNDNLSMNCTKGIVQNISINFERYNLNQSQSGGFNLTQFVSNYTNLTTDPIVNKFELNYRFNDSDVGIDDTNQTYWRIYIPFSVAGSCSGNIIFGASQSGAG